MKDEDGRIALSKEDRDNFATDAAFMYGVEFGTEHPLSEFEGDRDSDRLMSHCPSHLRRFADVFKYGCQSAWRRNGELPGMVAGDLQPGDVFTVDKPDPESLTRVCLANNSSTVKFGFPNRAGYWCSMGREVPVTRTDQLGNPI